MLVESTVRTYFREWHSFLFGEITVVTIEKNITWQWYFVTWKIIQFTQRMFFHNIKMIHIHWNCEINIVVDKINLLEIYLHVITDLFSQVWNANVNSLMQKLVS